MHHIELNTLIDISSLNMPKGPMDSYVAHFPVFHQVLW